MYLYILISKEIDYMRLNTSIVKLKEKFSKRSIRKKVALVGASIIIISGFCAVVHRYENKIEHQKKTIKTVQDENSNLSKDVQEKQKKIQDKDIENKAIQQKLVEEQQTIEQLKQEQEKIKQERDQLKKDLQSKKESERVAALSTKTNGTSTSRAQSGAKSTTSKTTNSPASSSGKTFLGSFNASAYTDDPAENGGYSGLTALGTSLRPGVVAVDPRVIPLGSRVYIEYPDGTPYGYGTAEDTGGAIKGKKLDIFIGSSKSAASNFGRRQMNVYLIK